MNGMCVVCMHVCVCVHVSLPPGRKSQVGVVLAGKPQWSTCHGVTSPVAVVCVCILIKWLKHWTAPFDEQICFSSKFTFSSFRGDTFPGLWKSLYISHNSMYYWDLASFPGLHPASRRFQ